MDFDPTEWLKQEFEMGGRKWRINKLPPIVAKEVLVDHIRPIFAHLSGVNLNDEMSVLILFGKIPSHHLKSMGELFASECIKTRNSAGQWVRLSSNIDEFTQDMDPMDLMNLDLRCIAVNFGRSVSKFVSSLKGTTEADTQPVPEAQTHSSTQESRQATTPSGT